MMRCLRPMSTRFMLVSIVLTGLLGGCERPPVDTVQRGYRGTGMEQVYNPRSLADLVVANTLPADSPAPPHAGPGAGTVFKNVQVLGDLSVSEFSRLMVSMTEWVAPTQGCTYCHAAGAEMSSDGLYTKVVARRMLQMTRHINSDWKTHVADTGVTCYTCHRGQPVPSEVWYTRPPQGHDAGMLGNKAGQNMPATKVGLTSLPFDPFTAFLLQPNEIRVVGETALPVDNRKSIKQTEWTYGLMMHMAQSLGVNCTYCHNTRSMASWESSTPQRATAWYGIRMARDLNSNYLAPLASVFPAGRLGPDGDAPKLNCATCHQGAYKPLQGASMLPNHPELSGVRASIAPPVATAAPPGATATPAPVAASPASATVLFAVGSATLSAEGKTSLQPLIDAMKADATSKVQISGFHSASGDLAQNQDLAKRRALSVREALQAAGIGEDRLVLERPQSTEANLAGEDPKSRRVEISLK